MINSNVFLELPDLKFLVLCCVRFRCVARNGLCVLHCVVLCTLCCVAMYCVALAVIRYFVFVVLRYKLLYLFITILSCCA